MRIYLRKEPLDLLLSWMPLLMTGMSCIILQLKMSSMPRLVRRQNNL